MRNGGGVKWVMTKTYDDPIYTGDGNGVGDPSGTILGVLGTEYTVNNRNGAWITAGYNEGDGRYVDGEQYKYYENLLGQNMMNVWGRGMTIDSNGNVRDADYGVVGQITEINGQKP